MRILADDGLRGDPTVYVPKPFIGRSKIHRLFAFKFNQFEFGSSDYYTAFLRRWNSEPVTDLSISVHRTGFI